MFFVYIVVGDILFLSRNQKEQKLLLGVQNDSIKTKDFV